MSRALVIANPAARGGARDIATEVLEHVRAHGWDAREEFTRAPGDAIRLARRAAREGIDTIIAVGGDGTAGEVAEGLARASGLWQDEDNAPGDSEMPVLAIVPGGTGNSIYRALWGDRPWRDTLDGIHAGDARVRALDIGRVSGIDRAFFLGASTGFLARVVEIAAGLDHLSGRERYGVAAMQALQSLQSLESVRTRVSADGAVVWDGDAIMVVAGGARHRSGAFEFLPRSVLDDGMLDVCVISSVDSTALGEIAGLLVAGTHLAREEVRYAQGRSITIERTDGAPLAFERDGDLAPVGASVTLDIVAGAVRAWTPREPVAG